MAILLDRGIKIGSAGEINRNEIGAMASLRLYINPIPGPGIGLLVEGRFTKSFYSWGTGANISHFDAQFLAGIRFGLF